MNHRWLSFPIAVYLDIFEVQRRGLFPSELVTHTKKQHTEYPHAHVLFILADCSTWIERVGVVLLEDKFVTA